MQPVKQTTLMIGATLFLVLFNNLTFFAKVWGDYEHGLKDAAFLGSLGVLLAALLFFLINLFGFKILLKPLLVVLTLIASLCSYFLNTFGTIIDTDMIRNVFETNTSEAFDLITLPLMAYLVILGILPSILIAKIPLQVISWKKNLFQNVRNILIALAVMAAVLFGFNRYYTSFFREHKTLRYYTNPVTPIYALVKYTSKVLSPAPPPKSRLVGQDAKIVKEDANRELIILVVGEAARSDHFQLNGYERETNPLLSQEEVYSFSDVHACGTSTAISVPCMFSLSSREHFNVNESKATENILDILARAGVNVLWRDNNSDSKGVAFGLEYQDYKDPKVNTICDVECRDEGMLVGLNDYIESKTDGDIFIVLHQMGNHGPAYYKRYPDSFEIYTPTCKTNQLQECQPEEIRNAYDNALVYTDYFLHKVIDFLRQYDHAPFEVSMIYFSDHGESLGEGGLYLHGIPYFMAPEAQTKVPAIFWFGNHVPVDREAFRARLNDPISQDSVSHTLLGMFEVETSIYDASLDLSAGFIIRHTPQKSE